MRNSFFKLLIFASAALANVSCSNKEVFFKYHSFANAEWSRSDTVVFNVKIEDNSQPYDVSVELRHNDDYPFSNIYLFVDYKTPDGESHTDTLKDEAMADIYGKWKGKGLSLYNRSISWQPVILFPDTGTYVYSICQGMRIDPLKGISDIGLKVSKKSVK